MPLLLSRRINLLQPCFQITNYRLQITNPFLLRLAFWLGGLAYLRAITFSFVLDDFGVIVINPWLESWRFIPQFFSSHVWASLGPNASGSYYRPLFLLWLSLNRHLFGLTPGWWHLAAIAAHLGCSYLVYLLAKRILGDEISAALSALLFAVMPSHIEAVAWVSGASEVLLALTFISSFLLYLDSRKPRRFRVAKLSGSLLLYGAALLAKETAIILPILIFVHSWMQPPNEKTNSSRFA